MTSYILLITTLGLVVEAKGAINLSGPVTQLGLLGPHLISEPRDHAERVVRVLYHRTDRSAHLVLGDLLRKPRELTLPCFMVVTVVTLERVPAGRNAREASAERFVNRVAVVLLLRNSNTVAHLDLGVGLGNGGPSLNLWTFTVRTGEGDPNS